LERRLARSQQENKGLKDRYTLLSNDLAIVEQSLELFTATRGDNSTRRIPRDKRARSGSATAIFGVCDWHAEETVEPKTIGGKNKFNLKIAEARIERLWQKAIHLTDGARHLSNIDECLIAVLGDLIGGHIHDELMESNSLTPLQAARWVQHRLMEGIRFIVEHGQFKRIRIRACSGNHGRDTKKTRIATREKHSYEWFAYMNVKDWCAEKYPQIEFEVADGLLMMVDVEGHLIRLTHGDSIKYGGGVGGLTVPANKKVSRWNSSKPAYLTLFGHFHQHLATRDFICCPTLKGYDTFSEFIGAGYEPPGQLFAVIDKDRGLTEEKVIFVE
jgi:hypothetical protein